MKAVMLSLAATFLGASAALAAPDTFAITPEERAACGGDAVSLCAATFPDRYKLLACMKAKRQQLSPICNAAFTAGLKRRGIPL